MRHTVRALIIRNKKILLVTGHNAGFYWTPGGGQEAGESDIDTLKRELYEELGVQLVSAEYHSTHEYDGRRVYNYIATIEGTISVGGEITGYAWFNSQSDSVISEGIKSTILPELYEQQLID